MPSPQGRGVSRPALGACLSKRGFGTLHLAGPTYRFGGTREPSAPSPHGLGLSGGRCSTDAGSLRVGVTAPRPRVLNADAAELSTRRSKPLRDPRGRPAPSPTSRTGSNRREGKEHTCGEPRPVDSETPVHPTHSRPSSEERFTEHPTGGFTSLRAVRNLRFEPRPLEPGPHETRGEASSHRPCGATGSSVDTQRGRQGRERR